MCAKYKLLTGLLICEISTLFLIIPSVSIDAWMNETQSGKTFIFLYGIAGIGALTLLRFIFLKNYRSLKISLLDVLLFIWVAYTFTNGILHGIPFSLRILDLTGLIVLYLVFRQIELKYYPILFFALVLGGFIQAVYGNLQLWGYYPSHHGMFKMTGSFFNPGPYAGYLAGVFPVVLGFYLFKFRLLTPKQEKIMNRWFDKLRKYIYEIIRNSLRYFPKHANGQKEPLTAKQNQKPEQHYYIGVLYIAIITVILLVIPASRSRASWLAIIASSGYLLVVKYKTFLHELNHRIFNTTLKKAALIVMLVMCAGGSIFGLYHFKKGSANGRILIWNVTSNIIKDHSLTGVGFDRFKANYMDYQAAYFRQKPESEEAMVAGDTNYAFNEFLQQTSENGVVGLLLVLLILVVVFSRIFSKAVSRNQKENNSPHFDLNRKLILPVHPAPKGSRENQFAPFRDVVNELIFSSESPNTDGYKKENNTNHLILIAKAGIISILVFGLFSYPAQILPIKMSFVLFFATIAKKNSRFFRLTPFRAGVNQEKNQASILIRIALIVCVLFAAGLAIKQLTLYTNAYKNWNSAYRIYQVGAYDACLENYDKAYPVLKTNGDFLTNYGKALSMAEKHLEAVNILQQAEAYYPNIIVYTALGDSYKNLDEPEKAEEAYSHAWYMNPSKFYPKYLLAKLYEETGQMEKAVFTAIELMHKQIKVESTAIREIRDEMQKIIEKGEL